MSCPLFVCRGSEGGGGDRHPAPEQSHSTGELPEADRAAERPDRYREPDGAGHGECCVLEGKVKNWHEVSKTCVSAGVHTRGVSVQAHQEGAAAEDVLPGL